GVIAGELGLRLSELHFVGARIDLRQQIALADELSLFERDAGQLAVQTGFHGDRIERRDRAEPAQVDRDVPHARRSHGDRDARRGASSLLPDGVGSPGLRLLVHPTPPSGARTPQQPTPPPPPPTPTPSPRPLLC